MRYLLVLLIAAPLAYGQTCMTSTCNAASPSQSDFLAALPASGNTNATVVVNIPSGTSGWTGGINYTVPSAVTNLTIQGNTTVTWSGTHGTATWNYSVTNSTIIQDADVNQGDNLLALRINNSNQVVRITGITLEGGSSSGKNKYNGVFYVTGGGQFRWDHSHINNNTYSPAASSSWLRVTGSITGVLDHNVVDLGNQNSVSNGFQAYGAYNDSIGLGDGTWAHATPWGSLNALYMEDNYFTGGAPDDCADGGAFVMRYNTINGAYVGIQTHATKSPGGPTRGCRYYEAYHNYFTGNHSAASSAAMGSKGGPALVWGNNVADGYYRLWQGATDRESGDETETNTPNGWGYCGTATNSNGIGSPWDGNQTATTGYPCLDGLGRGQTKQALNGSVFPNRLNSSTGTIAWPQQALEPIYLWNNAFTGNALQYMLIQDPATMNNRDYYYDCGAWNSSCSSFTGASGTGFGVLASRPSTCTAGGGGTYLTSPSGSYGVSYFATDSGSNGTLYVCDSTNHWTSIYQPAPYPHPLAGGSSPTTNNLSISATNGTVTGTNCAAGNYTTGTTIGACTFTPTAGYTANSWITAGSASCTGTSPCGPFNLDTDTSLTISATSSTPQAATPTSSPGNGVLSGPTAVTLACTTPSPTIYYTTDGSTPTHGSTVYSSPVAIGSGTNTTFKAICTASGYTDSSVLTAGYLVVSAGPQGIVGTPSSTGSGTAINITRTVGGTGNVLYLELTSGNGINVSFRVSDSFNSSWNLISTINLPVDQDTNTLYCAVAPSSGSDTVSFSSSAGGANRALLYEAQGSTCGTLVPPVSSYSASTTACNSGSMSIPSAAFLLGLCGTDGTTPTLSAGSGWSNGATAGAAPGSTGILGESQEGTAGSYTATSTACGLSAEEGTIIAAFSPSTDTSTCADPVQKGSANGFPAFSYSNTYPSSATPLNIGFTSPTSSCAMHMTLDGSAPNCSSTAYADQSITATTVMRVIACGSANPSTVLGGTWTITGGSTPAPTGFSIIVIGP